MNKDYLDYVWDYFYDHFKRYSLEIGNDEKHSLLMNDVCSSVMRQCSDYEKLKAGEADSLICNHFFGHLIKISRQFKADYQKLGDYVKDYIMASDKVNCSDKTFDYIVSRISVHLMPYYNYEDLNNGILDDKIVSYYNEFCKDIKLYVTNYIAKMDIPLTDVDEVFVASEIFNLIMSKDGIDVSLLFKGELNNKINELVVENRKKNEAKRLEQKSNVLKHIWSLMPALPSNKVSSDTLSKIVEEIYDKLQAIGLTHEEITSKDHEEDIKLFYHEYYAQIFNFPMLNNSIRMSDEPDKIEEKTRKIDIMQALSSMLVVGVLATSIGYLAYSDIKTKHEDSIKENLSKIDSYSYSTIDSIYSDRLSQAADNILNTYEEYSGFKNQNYDYLAVYRSFKSANSSKYSSFYIMDKMLSEVKTDVPNIPDYAELKSTLRTNSCFLDFVYDRLYEMGFTEIREDKYTELLDAYVRAKNDNPLNDPVKYLSESKRRLLNKVASKYSELSEQYFLELGVLLGNQDNSETDGKPNTNRRYH